MSRFDNERERRSLGGIFRRLISATGPISLSHYMAENNARYYADRDPFGAAGDFITAPEVAPVFSRCLAAQCEVATADDQSRLRVGLNDHLDDRHRNGQVDRSLGAQQQ